MMDLESHHFCCGDCLKSYSCPVLVMVHHKVEHEFRCACDRQFHDKASLVKHMNEFECRFPFSVKESSQSVNGNSNVLTNSLASNGDMVCKDSFDPVDVCIKQVEDSFLCNVCDKLMAHRTQMSRHVSLRHGSVVTNLTRWHMNVVVNKHSVIVGEMRLCAFCGKLFVKKMNMYQHLCLEHKDEIGQQAVNFKKIRDQIRSGQFIKLIPQNPLYVKVKSGGRRCRFCSFYCPSLRRMTTHFRKHRKLVNDRLGEILKNMTVCKVSEKKRLQDSLLSPERNRDCGVEENNGENNNSRRIFDRKQRLARIEVLLRFIKSVDLGFKCRLCHIRRMKRSSLYQHIEVKHEDVLKKLKPTSAGIVRKPLLKAKSFSSKQAADTCKSKGHIHRIKSRSYRSQPGSSQRCKICNIVLSPRSDMNVHVRKMHAKEQHSPQKNFGRICGTVSFNPAKSETEETDHAEEIKSVKQETETVLPAFHLQQSKFCYESEQISSTGVSIKQENPDSCTFEGNPLQQSVGWNLQSLNETSFLMSNQTSHKFDFLEHTDSKINIGCNVLGNHDDNRKTEFQNNRVESQNNFDSLVLPEDLVNYHKDLPTVTSESSLNSVTTSKRHLGVHSSRYTDFIPWSSVTKRRLSTLEQTESIETKPNCISDVSKAYCVGTGLYACSICRQNFASKSGWYKHRSKFHSHSYAQQSVTSQASASAKLWSCGICQRRFASYLGWRKHFIYCKRRNSKNSSNGYRLAFKTEIEFLRKNCERRDGKFCCRLCGLSYSKNFRLFAHIRAKHDMVDVSCDQTESTPVRRRVLRRRTIIQKHFIEGDGRFICKVCDSEFRVTSSARKHLRKKHPELIDPVGSSPMTRVEPNDVTQIECAVTDRHQVKTQLKPKSHSFKRISKSFSSTKNIQAAAVGSESSLLKSCGRCNRRYITLKNLTVHVRRVHLNKNSKPIRCCMCNRSFNLSQHAVMHFVYKHCKIGSSDLKFRKRNISCQLCCMDFSCRTSQYRHYSEVHADICVRCEFCDAAFLTQTGLSKHIKSLHSADQTSRSEETVLTAEGPYCLPNDETDKQIVSEPFECLENYVNNEDSNAKVGVNFEGIDSFLPEQNHTNEFHPQTLATTELTPRQVEMEFVTDHFDINDNV